MSQLDGIWRNLLKPLVWSAMLIDDTEICQSAQTNLFQEVELVEEEVAWSLDCWDQKWLKRAWEEAAGCRYSQGEEVEVEVDRSSAHDPLQPVPPSLGVGVEGVALHPAVCWWCPHQGWWASWELQEAARLYQSSNCGDGRNPVKKSDTDVTLEF